MPATTGWWELANQPSPEPFCFESLRPLICEASQGLAYNFWFALTPLPLTFVNAMPIYAYKCAACGHAKDVLQKISDAPLTTCPSCGADQFAKQLTAAGFQLKGSGWYATDFKGSGSSASSPSSDASDSGSSSTTTASAETGTASGGCGTSCACH